MEFLFEIKLTNIRSEKDLETGETKMVDHFNQRKEERLYSIEPTLAWNKLFVDLPQELDKSQIQREMLTIIKDKVNENINKCASVDASKETLAIIPIADLRIKTGNKSFLLPVQSSKGEGSFYYIRVVKNYAATLILTNDPNPESWREQQFRSNQNKSTQVSSASEIPIINAFNPIIIVDYDSIINNALKQSKTIDTDISFNIKDLSYDPKSIGSSDYRPKSGGKELYLTINIPGEGKKKLKIKSSGTVNIETGLISKVELDAGSPGNALAYKLKLNNKVKNGFGMLQVENIGSTLILKDLYLPGAFDNKGNFIKTIKMVAESYIRLLEKLTKKKVILK